MYIHSDECSFIHCWKKCDIQFQVFWSHDQLGLDSRSMACIRSEHWRLAMQLNGMPSSVPYNLWSLNPELFFYTSLNVLTCYCFCTRQHEYNIYRSIFGLFCVHRATHTLSCRHFPSSHKLLWEVWFRFIPYISVCKYVTFCIMLVICPWKYLIKQCLSSASFLYLFTTTGMELSAVWSSMSFRLFYTVLLVF